MPAFSAAMPQLPLKQGQGPLALIMAPVRELAQQIQVEAERFGGAIGIKSVCVYGGAPKGPQIGALSRGRPVLVVGTPGRLNDLLNLANPPVFNLESCKYAALATLRTCRLLTCSFSLSPLLLRYLVLDEADRMLDMGFEPQIKQVVEKVPKEHQVPLAPAPSVHLHIVHTKRCATLPHCHIAVALALACACWPSHRMEVRSRT